MGLLKDLDRLGYHMRELRIVGDEIIRLEQDRDGVNVTFGQGSPRRFDLVIGADGLHSVVRSLTFGPQHHFEQSLGYTVAAFESSGYRPRNEDVYAVSASTGSREIA
ncbi:MAG TPA: hypothetical protein VHW71_03200 [Steroidobacteraceae bacterium]|jgi:2-polyprenyl-6-methoxyphenol hydroxylase-like FAD-dependent oxidoreductase|nr:hypothetical protein [Steroidobacteraceae bacterium]